MEIGPANSAIISQEQPARTGVLHNPSFTTEEHGYLSPAHISESRWARVTQENQGGKGRYNVDLRDDGLRATGDWFKSRSEHGHLVETIRPTRAGITLVRAGRDPVINSTFEFPLEVLFYLDADGDLWSARDIQQGHNTTLQLATTPEFDRWIDTEEGRFSSRNRRRIILAKDRPGHFFAAASKAPGLPTLTAINWKDTHTLITGPVTPP
jgi:hypothetical protein